MPTTEPITPTVSDRPTLAEVVNESAPLFDTIFVAGPPVLLAGMGTVLFALMLAGPFLLIVTLAVALAAVAALVTLVGALLASPYLLVRHFGPRLAERRRAVAARARVAPVAPVARAPRATERPARGLAV